MAYLLGMLWPQRGFGGFFQSNRGLRQRKHLKESAVKGNQVPADKAVSGVDIVIEPEL
jgi:hypothetical protein